LNIEISAEVNDDSHYHSSGTISSITSNVCGVAQAGVAYTAVGGYASVYNVSGSDILDYLS